MGGMNGTDLGDGIVALLPRLRRFAIALCRNADVADDLVQSTCERALASAGSEPVLALDAFLFRILRNLWYDRLRRRKVRGEEVEFEDRFDPVTLHRGAPAERQLMLKQVAAAIEALPDDQRELMLLVCVEEVSYRDAADILGLPIGTVMSRLSRARRKVAEATGHSAGDL